MKCEEKQQLITCSALGFVSVDLYQKYLNIKASHESSRLPDERSSLLRNMTGDAVPVVSYSQEGMMHRDTVDWLLISLINEAKL